jgi:hypothetical protein
VRKHVPTVCCLWATYFRFIDLTRLKAKGWKKLLHADNNSKRTEL